jgi:hypothetical protein
VAGVFTIDDPDAADHGMGNALILRHVLSSGEEVFSLYGHLAHLERDFAPGEEVLRGEVVGLMGGSGFGEPTYWGWHLHFEIKTAAVLGDPKSGEHEGYTPTPAGKWGYFDPAQFIDQVQFVPEGPEALSPPEPPSGPATAAARETVRFRSGGAACTWGHRVEYRFDWGDGEGSGWREEPSATHAWAAPGGFTVRVRARCADNPPLLSETATAAIEITEPGPDPPPAAASSNGGGCFIATAAWGANAPELHALRRLRDEWLSGNRPGRAFIARYYRLSPAAACFLAASPLRRALVRGMLRPPYWAAECWLWLGGRGGAWLAVVALGWLAFCKARAGGYILDRAARFK